jgi:hypothetical protein
VLGIAILAQPWTLSPMLAIICAPLLASSIVTACAIGRAGQDRHHTFRRRSGTVSRSYRT